MCKILRLLTVGSTVLALAFAGSPSPAKRSKDESRAAEITGQGPAVLWRNPADIGRRNLYYGSGGKQHAPHGSVTFKKEDLDGTNPKFDVVDQSGTKWKVKMGDEARPETAASRIVWAAGYFTTEDYFVPELRVKELPRLHRGQKYVKPGGVVYNVRLKRAPDDEKKIGEWQWAKNPFQGTREWNGLRVLMAVINNWDLKDENNAVYQLRDGVHGPAQIYLVSDLGASFGTTGLSWTRRGSKGNLKAYSRSHLIRRPGDEYVDFYVPSRPALDHYPDVPEVLRRLHLRWIGQDVPRADAHWMGELLAKLSREQISDTFRCAGYTPEQVEGFTAALKRRIGELQSL